MTDPSPSSSQPQPEPCETDRHSNETHPAGMRVRLVLLPLLVVVITSAAIAVVTNRTSSSADHGVDGKVTTLGSVEVTGRLVEIRGKFLPNDGLYNYAFVMKYDILEVHRGELNANTIVVAQYNPLKPRPQVGDEFYPHVGGDLKNFQAGDRHRMALEFPIDEHYIGGIVDRYYQEKKGPIYWAVWTNLAS